MAKPPFDPNKPFTAVDDKPPFDPSKPFEAVDDGKTGSGEAAFIGLQKGASFGTRPTVAGVGAGLGALVGNLGMDVKGEGLVEKLKRSGSSFGPAFSEARSSSIAEQQKAEMDRPGASLAGNIGGAVLTLPLTAVNTLKGAVGLGAATGAGAAIGESESVGDAATKVGTGALFGAAGYGAAKGLSKAAGYAANKLSGIGENTAKGAITTFLGPKREAIDAYLKRASDIKAAKSIEEIKGSIDDIMEGYLSSVDSAKLSKVEAKEGLRLIEQQIRDATQDANFAFNIKRADIKDSLKTARSALDSSFEGAKTKLTSIKSPIQMTDDVQAAIQDLKSQVTKGSAESYKILDSDPNAYSVRNAGSILKQMADDMNIQPFQKSGLAVAGTVNNGGPVTSQTAGVQDELRAFASRLENTPEQIPARELKKILQQIDQSEKAMYGQPGFDGRVSQAYKMVRAKIDEAVKAANPAYRAKMDEVASKSNLLNEALDRFSDPRATVSRLNSISSRTAGEDRAILQNLGNSTGRDFKTAIDQFSGAQGILKDPRAVEQLKRSLPEYENLIKAESRFGSLSRPETKTGFVDAQISKLNLPEELAKAKAGLTGKEQGLADAIRKLEPVKALSPNRTQSIVQNLLRDPSAQNIESRAALKELSTASQTDFLKMIDDLKVQRSFSGEFRNGSRNVVLGGIMGFITGGLPGAGGGAAVGGVIDRYGPKVAQKILDGYLAVANAPSLQKIQALQIPQEAKQYLAKELLGLSTRLSTGSMGGQFATSGGSMQRRMERISNEKDK